MTRIRRLLGPLLAVLTLGALLATAAPDVAHGIVSGSVAANTLRTSGASGQAAAADCQNVHVWNASTTEYIRLKRANGTTRDLLPQTETSGSYRYVQVPDGDDVRVTKIVSGGPSHTYTATGYNRVDEYPAWDCSGGSFNVIRVN